MEREQLELMRDASEVVHYERDNVRLYIRTSSLSRYPDMRAPCHWHDDLEWIYVLDGQMGAYIDGERVTLHTGDTLLVNTRRMHYGYSPQRQECHFACVLFHPSLFTGSAALLRSDVRPVLEHPDLKYWHLTAGSACGGEAAEILTRISALKEEAAPAYEMEVIGLFHILWSKLLRYMGPLPPVAGKPHTELDLQREMVACIYRNYENRLTLSEIAAAGHVSRSRCCQIFQRHLQQSPVDYLNTYRLKVCANLLRDTERTITEIALSCGFNHLSYFSKLFTRVYGCTPREYRKLSGLSGQQKG